MAEAGGGPRPRPRWTWVVVVVAVVVGDLLGGVTCRRRAGVVGKETARDLIGWRGEIHKVENAKPEDGKPFVLTEFWEQDVNQPMGLDQWVAWYAGYKGFPLDDVAGLLMERRDAHQKKQPTKPCMPLSKFVSAGEEARMFDQGRKKGSGIKSFRVFPQAGLAERGVLPGYAHMATLAVSPNGSIALAFQASPGIEGADAQRIQLAFTKGRSVESWWPAGPVPVKQGGGHFKDPENKFVTSAQWGPVLHEDREDGRLLLIYSESTGDCHEPASPEDGHDGRWVVGGDVRVSPLLDHGDGGDWGPPRSIHKQNEGKVPKITANGAIVHSSGSWILPFWRQKPRHIFIHDPETDQTTRRCNGPKREKRRTSAAVLISKDRGKTWRSSPKPIESRTAGWLIENTLVELSDASLLMLFRTKAGAVFSCKSVDGGETWSTAAVIEELVNTDSKIHLIKLRDGRLLLAFNDHPRPFVHDRAKNELVASRERTRMVVSISSDEGSTWKRLFRIDEPSESAPSGGILSGFFGNPEASKRVVDDDFPNQDSENPFQLRDMDETSDLAVQYHYPWLLELPQDQSGPECSVLIAYTKSRLNVVSQKTNGHEIWVSCIPL
ncbi:sialidase [Chloropicon primus]|uniref:Sialidase n=2 Tax=Chloropicon primus TaxID=1764295 RepID=A0A5B8MEE6_9CHLO|nr:sialidase [Chloropicon primus]UPQ97830.1 sialidase [Chloropicon primus]|eukprot:QDZ18621.1 sialidase [Chloropicon primus]